MESPTAKLNAYLLNHQAGKMVDKPGYYNFTSTSRSTRSYSSSWLQDVLSMPNLPRLSDTYREELNETDYEEIHERRRREEREKEQNLQREVSTTTLDLVQADPSTGKYRAKVTPHCECKHDNESIRQYEELMRHEDASLRRETVQDSILDDVSYCQCDCKREDPRSETPDWVHGLIQEQCDMTQYQCDMTQSMLLPDNYSLIETTTRSTRSTRKKKKKSSQPAEASTPYQSQHSIVPPTPDTANVMLLLQKAMKQLNEVKIDLTTPPRYVTSPQVKQAVEDTTVSAITNDLVTDSQHTLAGLSAVSSLVTEGECEHSELAECQHSEPAEHSEDTLELVQADPTGRS